LSLNALSPEIWKQRSDFKKLTRQFFDELGFIEIDTPFLVEWPSLEPHLDPYQVGMENQQRAFLSSSPEFGLKKSLGQGCTKVYELAHSYRSHEQGPWHSREFIMLEWYQVGLELQGLLQQCSHFLKILFPHLPQHRFRVQEWMARHGFSDISGPALKAVLQEQGCPNTETMDADEAFFRLFLPTESQMETMGIVFLYH
jgi:elongation factor P--(R)-beta-lysine ligase